MEQQLRAWQSEALDLFFQKKSLVAEVATGAGKTFYAVHCMQRLMNQNPNIRILIVVPKLVIIDSWLKDLYHFFPISKIGFFYKDVKEYSPILITTYSSLNKINISLYQAAIFDEVHNMYTTKQLQMLRSNFQYKLGLSATLKDEGSARHWKMLKEFNYNRFTYDMHTAIADGVLNKYELYNMKVSFKEAHVIAQYTEISDMINFIFKKIGGFNVYMTLPNDNPDKLALQKLFDRRNKLVYNYHEKYRALEQILRENKGKKIIIFNEYNDTGSQIYWRTLDSNFKCRVVNSACSDSVKRKNIEDFAADKYDIMITTKMFDEGYNLPSIDVAIIFSGNSTERQTKQRIGRVLRLKEHNSRIYQIYVQDTFEQDYADKRTLLFKDSACKFEEINV